MPSDFVDNVVDAGVDDVGGGGDGPQRADGGMQRGEFAVAPHVGTHEAGSAADSKNQEAGSAGDAAGGSSADAGWGKDVQSEERAVTAVVEDSAEGRRAATLPRQAATVADEPRLSPDETEGYEDKIPYRTNK